MDLESILSGKISWWWTVVSLVIGGAIVHFGAPYFSSVLDLENARLNRAAEMRIEEYKQVQDEIRDFNLKIQALTIDLQNGKKLEPSKQRETVEVLLKQYDTVRNFRSGLPSEHREAADKYLTSIAALRKILLETKNASHLSPLYFSYADYLNSQKILLPLLERSAGKTLD